MLNRLAELSNFKSFGFCILGFFVLSIAACAARDQHKRPAPRPAPTSEKSIAARPASALTVLRLLETPLQDDAAFDEISAALAKLVPLEALLNEQFHGAGPATLADGYILDSTWIQRRSGHITVRLQSEPCFSPKVAQAAIAGLKSNVTEDVHGADHGETYSTRRKGVLVSFATTPLTYRCVNTIYISKIN